MTGCSPAQGSGSNELNSPRWQAALSNTDAQLTLVSPPRSLQVSSLDQIKEPSKKARGDGKKDDTDRHHPLIHTRHVPRHLRGKGILAKGNWT